VVGRAEGTGLRSSFDWLSAWKLEAMVPRDFSPDDSLQKFVVAQHERLAKYELELTGDSKAMLFLTTRVTRH